MIIPPISPDVLSEAVTDIIEKGREEAPREVVGFICPDSTLFWLTNEADEDYTYSISGAQLSEAIGGVNGAHELGFNLLDIILFHTHPMGVNPSSEDLESRRQEPFDQVAHLVVSVRDETAAFY